MGLNQIVIRSPLVAPTRIRIMEAVGAFVIIGSIGTRLQDSVLRVSAISFCSVVVYINVN